MKFVFVINPVAGTGEKQRLLAKKLEQLSDHYDIEVYFTQYVGDAKRFINTYCEDNPVCFVACGGDGTLHEVAGGVYQTKHKVACIPCGSGNDFIKNVSIYDYFDLLPLFQGREERIDVLLCNNRVCINNCCIGFDSKIASNKDKFKLLPGVSGKMAYILSLLYCFSGSLEYELTISDCNGNMLQDGSTLLCLLANGRVYGGGFEGAPLAFVDDGLIDLCFSRSVSKWKILSLILDYKKGRHPNSPKYQGIITYQKGVRFTIASKQNFIVCLDGECFEENVVDVRMEACALGLWLPQNATLLKSHNKNEEEAFV